MPAWNAGPRALALSELFLKVAALVLHLIPGQANERSANALELRHQAFVSHYSVVPFQRETMRQRLGELASRGVFIGTSSWKYSGWCEMLYKRAK